MVVQCSVDSGRCRPGWTDICYTRTVRNQSSASVALSQSLTVAQWAPLTEEEEEEEGE